MNSGTATKVTHILLIEDDKAHQDLVLRAFSNDPETFRLSIAGNLREARQITERDLPDLIISDWILPDGKGLDILDRKDGVVTIPLIIMTSYGDEHLAVEIMKSGAIDYVVKSATVFNDLPHIARKALRDWENLHERKRAEEAVRDSEKRIADIISFLPDAVLAIDNEGRVIAWNNAMEQMTGVAAEEMLMKGNYEYSIPFYGERRPILIDLILIEDEEIEKKYLTLQRDDKRITSEVYIPTLFGGKGAYLWGTASPLYDSAGNRVGAIEIIRDITDRKKSDDALRESEEILQDIIEKNPMSIQIVDKDGITLKVNHAFTLLFGSLPPSDFSIFTDLKNKQPALEKLILLAQSGEVVNLPDLYFNAHDSLPETPDVPVWVRAIIFPLKDKFGKPERFVFMHENITGRKRAEEVMVSAQQKMIEAQSLAHIGTWDWDMENDTVTWSEELYNLAGRDPSLPAPTYAEHPNFYTPSSWDRLSASVTRSLTTNESYNLELELIRPDGSIRWVNAFGGVKRDRSGKVIGLYGTLQDITDQKKNEQTLKVSEDRFRHISGLITDIAYSCTRPPGGVFSIDWITGAVGRITGLSDNEILAMGCWRGIVIEEDYPIFDEKIIGLLPGLSSQCDLRIRAKDGSIRWLTCFTECVSDPARPGYHLLFGGCRDITENKQSEEIRNAYQARLNSAMEIGSLAWWEMDLPDGAVRFDDRKATLLLRSPKEFHHYTDFTALLHPDDYDSAMQAMKNHLEGKEARYHADYRILASDGNYRWLRDVGGITSRHADGSPSKVTGIVIDITTSKMAEEALRQSEARYRLLAENIADVLWVLNIDTMKWSYMSPSIERLRGYTTEEVLAQSVEDVMTPASYAYIQKVITERMQLFLSNESGQNTYLDEIEQTCRDGSTVWTEVASRFLRDERGELNLLGLSRDISERKRAETALRTTEARFHALIQNSSDIIRILDRNGRILYESPSAERILGYPPGYLIGRDPIDYIHADDLERVKRDFQEVLDRINPGTPTEFRIRKADGEYLWVDSIGTNLLDVAGVNGIVITTRPIQQRKQAEAQIKTTLRQLEQNEALLRKVYDILPIGLWLADKNGKLLYGNPAGVKIWGAEPRVPIEQYGIFKARRYPSGEEIAPDDWALAHTILEGVTIKDELLEIDAFDGKKKIILNYTAPVYDTNGAIDGAIVVNQEITEKEQAEKALRDNEARLATAMDIANLVNWEFDVATGMFTFDDRFYALYETTADREGGNQMSAETYLREFVYPDDRPAVLAEIEKILTTKDPTYNGRMEHRITPRDGSVRTIIVRHAPIMDPDGKVIRTYGANQDITDRILMESEIRSLNTALEGRVKERTEALVETNEKLEEENAQRIEAEGKLQASYDEKVMLLKEIHHRVKNNLQIIASLLNLQSRYISDEKTLAAIKESQNRVKAMALVHEKLYRSEDIAHISLRDYIRFLGTGLFQFYDAKVRGIQFKLEISDIDLDIDAAIPLGLIINELISNSLKYAFPEGRTGEIFISVKKEGQTLNVLFRDTGIGIPADLDWRNAPSLGLRLVITLVDQMDGTVELDRRDGTTFTMVLHEKEPRSEK